MSTKWKPKKHWKWLAKYYTLQNFALKQTALGKLHGIQNSKCKNITNYISQIKDVQSKIEDLKISIKDAIVIHAVNKFDSQFRPYLMILNLEARQEAQLLILFKLTKSLEDKELELKNKNIANANFAKKEKSKLTSHRNHLNTKKKLTEDLDQKEKSKIYDDNHKGDYLHLIIEYFQCYKTGHISVTCLNNEGKKGLTFFHSSNHKFTKNKSLALKEKCKKMNQFS